MHENLGEFVEQHEVKRFCSNDEEQAAKY